MPVGASARGGCAKELLYGSQVMASTGTTSSWKELLLPQRAPVWGLCLQPRRCCPPGRQWQPHFAALEASHSLLCVRTAPAGKPGTCSRVKHRCCDSWPVKT